jgi:hypothetical protein
MIFVEEHMVQIRDGHGVEPAKVIRPFVEAGHFEGIYPQAGATGTGSEFGAYFQKLYASHITWAEKRLKVVLMLAD